MDIPVNIQYSDGKFTMFRTDTEYSKGWKTDTYITEHTWLLYETHMRQDYVWQTLIGKLDNEKDK